MIIPCCLTVVSLKISNVKTQCLFVKEENNGKNLLNRRKCIFFLRFKCSIIMCLKAVKWWTVIPKRCFGGERHYHDATVTRSGSAVYWSAASEKLRSSAERLVWRTGREGVTVHDGEAHGLGASGIVVAHVLLPLLSPLRRAAIPLPPPDRRNWATQHVVCLLAR